MRKFTFTLEPVRRIRRQEEQLVQVELASVLRERASIAEQLDESRRAERELYAYLRESRHSADELQHISRYGELHRQKIVDASVQLSLVDQSVERIRVRLAEARAKREALDKLQERQREEHKRLWLAEEARELDEIGSMRHGAFGYDAGEVAV